MTSRTLSEIPSYLHDSELYRSLNHDEPDCCKSDTAVNNLEALQSLLSTIRFWGVEKLPSTAIKYILTTQDNVLPILEPFDGDLRLSGIVIKIRSSKEWTSSDKLLISAEYGQLDIFRHFLHRSFLSQTEGDIQQAFLVAATHGHVECMRALKDSGRVITTGSLHKACNNSCSNGHLQCLRYALELGTTPDRSNMQAAVRNGHINCVTFLGSMGIALQVDDACVAAECGHRSCLEYILASCTERSAEVCTAAAGAGSLDCLQLACNMGCSVDTTALVVAARGGYIDCMEFALQKGATMAATVSEAACMGNHMICLLFAITYGCPLPGRCMTNAAHHGNLTIITLLAENQIRPTAAAGAAAAEAGQLQCLTYLHEELGCALDEQVLNAAALSGQLSVLQYVHSRMDGYAGTADTTAAAANSGSLDCLQFLREHGCRWDHRAAIEAAWHDDKHCLNYIAAEDEAVIGRAMKASGIRGPFMALSLALMTKTTRELQVLREQVDQLLLDRKMRG